MKKTIISCMLALVATVFYTSCDEDRDSNPVYQPSSELVLNVPGNAENNIYDLSNEAGSIMLTTSQPNNGGVPLAYLYNTEISFNGEDFVGYGESSQIPTITIDNKGLNAKIIEMNGDVCPETEIPLYIRVKASLAVDNTMGNAVSNVIKITVKPFAPKITVSLPTKMFIVGSFTASNGWSVFVPLPQGYSQDGFFYGVVYLEEGAEFKLSPKDSWGEDRGFDAVTFGDDSTSGQISQGEGTNMKNATAGWYTVVVKTKISGDKVTYTLTLSEAKVYLFGATGGDIWEWNDANKFTAPANANGEWVSPAFTGSGEIRIAVDCGIDWWKTEFTLDGENKIFYRDKDMPSNWEESYGAEYSQKGNPGGHIYLDFTKGTGHLEN